ncbi:hypothetical protein ACSFCW_16720 [Yokenella regensburgei]|uniref:hypothetical protein n=1 Tax=Yokenella regensburgei TaxID=158877 RepID=UPI003EDB684E
MSKFMHSRAMHQYYRNVFTRQIYLPESDAMPAHIVAEIMNYQNTDLEYLEPKIMAAQTTLDAEKDRALKLMLSAVVIANHAFDEKNQKRHFIFPKAMSERLIENVVDALKRDDSLNYLIAAIQLLFRINEIESALFLISNNLSKVSESPAVLKILLLICLMEEDYNQASVVIQHLTANSSLIGEDQLTLLMIVCGIYRLGGVPDSFIDFRPLQDAGQVSFDNRYEWLIEKTKSDKTTVLVACDKRAYFEHTLPLIFSIYETNRDLLDVHLHFYNADEEVRAHVVTLKAKFPELNISVSNEQVISVKGISANYTCRRFIFMRYALEVFDSPIMMLDADCLVRHPWTLVNGTEPELLLASNESVPLWEQVPAGFIYARPGDLAIKYLDRVAHFIDCNLQQQNNVFFIGQVALSFSLETLLPMEQLAITRQSMEKLADFHCDENAFSWVVSARKNGDSAYQQYKQSLTEQYALSI